MFKRTAILTYGIICYAIFFGTFLYAIGFVGDILVPKSIDSEPLVPLAQALIINLGLLGAFALQHTVMARPGFKRWWTRVVPQEAERSTYVLLSSVCLIALFAFWQPLGGVVWNVQDAFGQAVLYGLFAFGWLVVLVSTFLINHFDLFGLRQVWLYFRGKPYTQLKFDTPWLYRYVRHPLYVGFLIGLWAAPTMTMAHLVFSLLCTGYIFIGALLEERDLEKALPEYKQYKKDVPMFVPRFNSKINTAVVGETS